MKKILKKIKTYWLYILIGAIILLIGGGWALGALNKPEYQTAQVGRKDFTQIVSATGKVIAAEDVDLGFEIGGKVSRIIHKVGDQVKTGTTIAVLESGSLYATLLNRQAALESERVQLNEMLQGTRPEELQISETALRTAIDEAYTSADDAIRNKTDILFTDPETGNAKLKVHYEDYYFKQGINGQRVEIGDRLEDWREDQSVTYEEAKTNLELVQRYLNDLNAVVNTLSDESSESDADIATYRSGVSSARSAISSALSSLKSAYDAFTLDKAGYSSFEIDAQRAAVKSAGANVLQAQAALGDASITAPFEGIVTKVDLKLGQLVSSNTSVVSIISTAKFEIESYIPEADIAKVKVGDPAKVTLDAYTEEDVFDAVITAIDLSDTQVEGVSTYKTTFQFTNPDERIRSGMTANIDIETGTRQGVLSVPQNAIINKAGVRTVLVMTSDGKTSSRQIRTGSVDAEGNIEIVEGVSEGEVIVLNPPKK